MHKGQGVMHQLTCRKIFVKGISIVKTISFVYGISTVKKKIPRFGDQHTFMGIVLSRDQKNTEI